MPALQPSFELSGLDADEPCQTLFRLPARLAGLVRVLLAQSNLTLDVSRALKGRGHHCQLPEAGAAVPQDRGPGAHGLVVVNDAVQLRPTHVSRNEARAPRHGRRLQQDVLTLRAEHVASAAKYSWLAPRRNGVGQHRRTAQRARPAAIEKEERPDYCAASLRER